MQTRILMWPVIGLVVTGMTHLAIEAIWPGLQDFFVPASLAPLLAAYGTWIGYRGVQVGAGYIGSVLGGVVVGLLPLGLEVIGFGLLLDRGLEHGVLAGVYGMASISFGALLGAGFAMSGPRASAAQM